MYATERHEQIELLLAARGRVGVVDLAERFDVTTETIRRDLDHLESTGALRRVHGGAVGRERASAVATAAVVVPASRKTDPVKSGPSASSARRPIASLARP